MHRFVFLLAACTTATPPPADPPPDPASEVPEAVTPEAPPPREPPPEPPGPLADDVVYVRGAGELLVVSTDGSVTHHADAHALGLEPPRAMRFDGDRLWLREGLDGKATAARARVLPGHLAVHRDSRLIVADAHGFLRFLDGTPLAPQSPLMLVGAAGSDEAEQAAVLAGFDPDGTLCLTPRCTQQSCWPPTLFERGAPAIHGHGPWAVHRRICRAEERWVERSWSEPPTPCRGCLPAHVIGPRAGWVVWRTGHGTMPRHIHGHGGARAARLDSLSKDAMRASESGLPGGWPVALSPDGARTLVCVDDAARDAYASRCGLVPTAELALSTESPQPSTRSTSLRPQRSWVAVPELEGVADLEAVAVFDGRRAAHWRGLPVQERPWRQIPSRVP